VPLVSRDGQRIGYARCVGSDCNQLFDGLLEFNPSTGALDESRRRESRAIRGSYTTFADAPNPALPNGAAPLGLM